MGLLASFTGALLGVGVAYAIRLLLRGREESTPRQFEEVDPRCDPFRFMKEFDE